MTRNEYLTFREQWRKDYKQLSQEIRQLKNDRNRHFKGGNIEMGALAMQELLPLRFQAREMMEQLDFIKEEHQKAKAAA